MGLIFRSLGRRLINTNEICNTSLHKVKTSKAGGLAPWTFIKIFAPRTAQTKTDSEKF